MSDQSEINNPAIDRERMASLLKELNYESDRGVALVAVAMLDQIAKELLTNHFIDFKINSKKGSIVDSLFRLEGPIDNFSNRIKLCATLGLISESEFRYADRLKDIRNIFAHKLDVKFANDEIRRSCEHLFEVGGLESVPLDQRVRTRFIATASMLTTIWASRLPQVSRASLHNGPIGFL